MIRLFHLDAESGNLYLSLPRRKSFKLLGLAISAPASPSILRLKQLRMIRLIEGIKVIEAMCKSKREKMV